ncbi:hypothetical protein HYH38_08305 [Clostridium botulinum]|uniref:hypothetical protein n=1 Tax=Clostridium botulinum TaxID=1491 RepID=UPI001C9AFD83|nr:hypothetical protein [Clostridium botulinum]MBY6816464.1 hypothetical protein [Clostridium botulinum]MBY6827281.1 hypothetical protein [Clostridium botulinum]MBY6859229.1 hypothetical protein [Clostridium botulinum]MBY7041487.1 hypothetical protein [Clostridium botulinum]
MTDEEYEKMAVIAIRNYLKKDFTDTEIKEKFSIAIKRLLINAKELDNKPTGVVQATEGSQSITYKSGVEVGVITEDVKALLPLPYVRCL